MSPEPILPASPGRAGAPERIPCWLCGWPVVVRSSGSDRIYLFCMECGMQIVIHSAAGARRLRARADDSNHGFEPREAKAG